MSVFYKLAKSNMQGKSKNRYYAKAVAMGETHTKDIAKRMSEAGTVTEGDVYAVLTDLITFMKNDLGEGHIVVLDGFGRFKLAIESDTVKDPVDFDATKHIRGLRCKFIAQGHHSQLSSKMEKPFTSGIKCKRAPINDTRSEEEKEH
jgi:predicted histone-like DNA-binding protein